MTWNWWRSICPLALCLLVTGRVDAGIIIETDSAQALRDPANVINTSLAADGETSVARILAANDTKLSARRVVQRSFARPEERQADDLAGGRFRLFSSQVESWVDAINRSPRDESPRSKAAVIADGLRHSGHTAATDSRINTGIQIPAAPTVGDDEIVTALFALPEPSTLSLAILGAALATAMPLRRWRKRRKN